MASGARGGGAGGGLRSDAAARRSVPAPQLPRRSQHRVHVRIAHKALGLSDHVPSLTDFDYYDPRPSVHINEQLVWDLA